MEIVNSDLNTVKDILVAFGYAMLVIFRKVAANRHRQALIYGNFPSIL